MSRGRERAALLIHTKLTTVQGLIREVKVWKVPLSARYPNGVKYRLVLVDPITGNVLLLLDNHWPKGPHIHIGLKESHYEFSTVEDLIVDFLKRAGQEEKKI